MAFPLSEILANQGFNPPSVDAGAGVAVPGPVTASAVPPDVVAATAQGAAGATPGAAGVGGFLRDPKLMALLQAFGGLKTPATPTPDPVRPPYPVAPTQGNAGAIVNTGPTSAIASLLAAGMRPGGVPSLGSLITPQR